MSMQVSGVAAAVGSRPAQPWQLPQQNVKALSSALQAGNLSAARSAYQSLVAGPGSSRDTSPTTALAEVGKALDSGDLSAAQRALQALRANHRNHPHRPPATATYGGPPSVRAGAQTDGTAVGSLVNKLA